MITAATMNMMKVTPTPTPTPTSPPNPVSAVLPEKLEIPRSMPQCAGGGPGFLLMVACMEQHLFPYVVVRSRRCSKESYSNHYSLLGEKEIRTEISSLVMKQKQISGETQKKSKHSMKYTKFMKNIFDQVLEQKITS